ncbi:PPOX class F420-dependent oxidoreductase [Streptomyces iconiensis]|uniref:PPOX class F420-dependent oxidoreductase n=1 Tax=Streptomyces iconiensis TaxID=1384038 RepID=A0ABT6ZVY4_9ACTN|nr:PPOX class F420-dependent oxidoreductase [Streptomyces iconiensis]MDJ1133214.1 PPOX class F420-dependent oxidoreductase [Streptomyces iconiensis]
MSATYGQPEGTARSTGLGRGLPVTVALLVGVGTLVAGVWSLGWPASFAEAVDFPAHEHFLHDVGAFQIGLGVGALLACVWYDALATVLAGLLVANGVHTVNHALDLDHGGQPWHIAALAVATALIAAALLLRQRGLGWTSGGVSAATRPELTPYVRQKTVLLTTYRKDGTPGDSPVSIAVDGDHAYVRSFRNAIKTRRLRRTPQARVAPCTTRGRSPGAALDVRLALLEPGGPEDRHAARMLGTKYPLLHRVLVPFLHKVLLRRKAGGTVHFRVTVAPRGHGTP